MTTTLKQLAELTGATLIGDPSISIESVAGLDTATSKDVSFLANPLYTPLLEVTKAAAVCVDSKAPLKEGGNYLVSDDPSTLFQKIAHILLKERTTSGFSGIHPTAVIHPTAKLGKEVNIGPYAVVDQGAVIGDKTTLAPFSCVGPSATLGDECFLHSHSVVREHCQLGNRVILQPGAVIGSCGFGYTTTKEGTHTKIEQMGNVIVEDDVEIGANSTIDRARFQTTRIAKGSKIDNLVQIAHNVEVGEDNLIAAQTGIAGSTKTGRHVMMGGQVGIIGHLEISDGVQIAAQSGVSKHLSKGTYSGSPAQLINENNRVQVHTRKLAKYASRIAELEKKVEQLSELLPCN